MYFEVTTKCSYFAEKLKNMLKKNASKIKMVMRDDTVVYNADTFELTNSSMSLAECSTKRSNNQ